jgi:hypothetical protein
MLRSRHTGTLMRRRASPPSGTRISSIKEARSHARDAPLLHQGDSPLHQGDARSREGRSPPPSRRLALTPGTLPSSIKETPPSIRETRVPAREAPLLHQGDPRSGKRASRAAPGPVLPWRTDPFPRFCRPSRRRTRENAQKSASLRIAPFRPPPPPRAICPPAVCPGHLPRHPATPRPLDPRALDAVRIEGTQVLPDLSL